MRQRSIRSIALLLCLLVTLAAGCSSGSTEDLLGPGPKVGQAYRHESKMTMVDGTITITDGNSSHTGRIDMTTEGIDEEEILAVSDSRVTKGRIRVVSDMVKVVSDMVEQTVREGGQGHTIPTERNPLEGETIEFEKRGEDWRRTLVGKSPSAKQAIELDLFPPPMSDVDYYPAEPVKPGHRWKVDVNKLRRLLGNAVRIESGTWTRQFAKTITWDSERCAQIMDEIHVQGKLRDEGEQWVQLELKVAGPVRRSVARGFTVASSASGTVSISGAVTEDGKQLRTTISGSVTIERKTHPK
jgi:hypothetical protein